MSAQEITHDKLLAQFEHYKPFNRFYPQWNVDLKTIFIEFIQLCHTMDLDIFIVNGSGHDIRAGRKERGQNSAKSVFFTIQLYKDKIKYGQRYKHNPDHVYGKLTQEQLALFKQSNDFVEFNQEFEKGSKVYWPSDYVSAPTNIWKVSHSPSTFSTEQVQWLEEQQIITVHQTTGNGSAPHFQNIKLGDFVSLSYGSSVGKIVKVLSNINYLENPLLDDKWMMRKYEIVDALAEPVKYQGARKRWSPSFNGTCWKVPLKEHGQFEKEILEPYYHITLKQLGFETSNSIEIKTEESSMHSRRESALNRILYGPPGTGKTYHTIEAAVTAAEPDFDWDNDRELLKAEYERLVADGRIRFVTFHQSYGYEEFVEGLSAKTNNGVLSYFEKDGVFKSICDDAKHNMLDSEKSFEQLSAESQFDQALEAFKLSVFDDCDEYRLTDACSIIAIEHDGLRYGGNWQSAPIMKYADLKQLYLSGVETRQDIKKSELVSGLAKQHASYFIRALEAIKKHISSDNTAHLHTDKQNYVLVIDEINRGNMSKIFGELITLIEPSKRFGQPEALEATLPYSGAAFSVPDNLYLIGTMNTADRSLALMDTALRRRFDFVEMMPDYKALGDKKLRIEDVEIDIARLLETLNKRIAVLYDREHTLGHAFLIPVKQHLDADDHGAAFDELVSTFQNKIVPLLEEYFFEDWNKIRLIFGDNKKKDNGLYSYVLIGEHESSYDEIFGANHGLDSYEQKKVTYEVASFNEEGSPWKKPQSYVAIYDEQVLLATLNKLKTSSESEVND